MSVSLLSILSKLHTSALMFGLWLFLLAKSSKFSLFWWLFKYIMRKEHVLFWPCFALNDRASQSMCSASLFYITLTCVLSEFGSLKGPSRSAYDSFGFFF
jgi:hypothetical protein